MSSTTSNLTPASLELFLALAKDAPNWGGTPLFGGNVGHGKANEGHLTDLKKKGLVTTFEYNEPGDSWVDFTEQGVALAAEHGVDLGGGA